jgi:hypothetical protein
MYRTLGLGFLVLATAACFDIGGDAVDASPAENVIGTAAPLAHAGTLAMAILSGSPTTCAEIVAGCSTPPCEVEIGVSVGDGCHLPIGADAATGRVPVTGTFSTPGNANLIAVFHDVDVDGSRVIFRRGAFTVSRTGAILNMAYGNQGLELTEPTVSVEQAGWTVEVDTGATLGDTTDDRMEISGAQQVIVDSNITQVALAGVVISADCRLNPTAGSATIEKVGDSSGQITTLMFHAACDGRADVAVSLGRDHVAVDDTVPLRWFR